MNAEERKELVSDLIQEMKLQKLDFYIEPERHYNEHHFLYQLTRWYNRSAIIVGTIVITMVISGILWLLTLGFKAKNIG